MSEAKGCFVINRNLLRRSYPFKSHSRRIAYWPTDLPLKEFCAVGLPSSRSWGPVLKNINSINLPVKTCQRDQPTLVVLKCRTQDYTSKHSDSVGVFLSQIPRDNRVEDLKTTFDSHYSARENWSSPAVLFLNTDDYRGAWFISQSPAKFEKRKKSVHSFE